MARKFRGTLSDILRGGGSRAVARFLDDGNGPLEAFNFARDRYIDLDEIAIGTLVGHAQEMREAGDALTQGLGPHDVGYAAIPINSQLFGGNPQGDRYRWGVEVVIEEPHGDWTDTWLIWVTDSVELSREQLFDRAEAEAKDNIGRSPDAANMNDPENLQYSLGRVINPEARY